jgi:hypothetical protein
MDLENIFFLKQDCYIFWIGDTNSWHGVCSWIPVEIVPQSLYELKP